MANIVNTKRNQLLLKVNGKDMCHFNLIILCSYKEWTILITHSNSLCKKYVS